jgi:hypothetical protein
MYNSTLSIPALPFKITPLFISLYKTKPFALNAATAISLLPSGLIGSGSKVVD